MWMPPKAIWDGRSVTLSKYLCDAYRDVLDAQNLTYSKKKSVGGRSAQEAEDWFASNFESGAARFSAIQCGIVSDYELLARHMRAISTSGTSVIYDICCGSATATVTMIANLIDLRRRGEIKCTPVTLEIHGWEISNRALELAGELLDLLKHPALDVGIRFVWKPIQSDLVHSLEFAKLITALQNHQALSQPVTIIVGNISGTAKTQVMLQERLVDMCSHCQVQDWGFLWYEPNTTTGKDVAKKVRAKVTSFLSDKPDPVPSQPTQYEVQSCHSNEFSSGVVLHLWRVLDAHGGLLARPK